MSVISSSGHILIAGDSSAGAAALRHRLESAGYGQPMTLAEPGQVMTALADAKVELVLLESENSDIDAAELTRRIRARHGEAQLPVLVIATSPEPAIRCRVLAAGANDCLSKPVDAREIVVRIAKLLASRQRFTEQQATESSLLNELQARAAKLDALIRNGIMMSMERNRTKLLTQILSEGQSLLHCDGATLYLLTDEKTLRFALRTKDDLLPSLEIPLYDEKSGEPNEHYVSTYVALRNQPVIIDDVYRETRFDLSGTRQFDQGSHYRTVSLLTVPLSSNNGQVLGVLQFINALSPEDGSIIAFSRDVLGLVEALAAQAAVALDNLQLLESQDSLMDNLFQVIGTAIDAKSPYTGRHCNRVPELAIMLAEEAHADTGRFADFRFETPEEWREFKIGAWLHDCGKVTTPEYVIDKATKLETIHNRIHEIRTRFEVLLRDADIARLQAILDGENPDLANARYAERKNALTDDFSFVATSNIGTHILSEDDLARLARLAQTTWTRHFDDRLGISRAEAERYAKEAVQVLPAQEPLLADKPRHVFARDESQCPDPSYGFCLDIPQQLYNHGELYNLGVRRGTLTEEERYKINEHILCTIMMLEQMRFPKNLQRVPEYAGTHHEAINGTGYPRRLAGEALSIPSRIMAIADIFEALTAPDRPYKRANSISEAIKVLHAMKNERHIDADLFDLFLTSGLYRRYAETFLNPEQMDEVDISSFLGAATP